MIAGLSRVKVPVETRASVSSAHSSSEPVHQWIRSGWVIAATSSTKSRMPWWVVGGGAWGACVLGGHGLFPLAVLRGGSLGVVVGDSSVPRESAPDGAPTPGWGDSTARILAASHWIVQWKVGRVTSLVLSGKRAFSRTEAWVFSRPNCGRPSGRLAARAPARAGLISASSEGSAILVQSLTPVGRRAPVAQRIEHLTTDQKVWGSNPYRRAATKPQVNPLTCGFLVVGGGSRQPEIGPHGC